MLLLSSALILSSCLADSEDTTYTYYGDTAITAFSLGTVNQYLTTLNSAGEDSTYKTTVTGTDYPFVIDHAQGLIYNTDSLPYGCDASAILATISCKNSGYIYLRSLEKSDSLIYYSSSDSIDFSQPRQLVVFAQDVQRYREYTVTVNVHQQEEGVFTWSQQSSLPFDLSNATRLKSAAMGDSIFLLASEGQAASIMRYDGTAWTACTPDINLALSATSSILTWNGHLYLCTDGTVIRSTDGNSWSVRSTATGITQLVAASATTLYGQTATGIVASTDGGATWTTEALDSDASLLPDSCVGYACQAVRTNTGIDRLVFVGISENDSYATVWSKLTDYNQPTKSGKWSYVDLAGDNKYALSTATGLTVQPYNSGLLAFGYKGGTYTPLYVSQDHGITWKANSAYAWPDSTAFTPAAIFTATVTTDNYLWLISRNGQVWRGRLNELGWK